MPETGAPRHLSSLKPQNKPTAAASARNLNHGEQKGGGRSEQKQSVRAPPEYSGVAITLPSILLKSPSTLHQMIHLHRNQADIILEVF
jgi:hypothetical protein